MLLDFIRKNSMWFTWAFLLTSFIFLRLPAIHRPYHQDEYKWVQYSHPEIIPPGTVPHPPLTEFIYTKIAPLFGDHGFRFIPLLFSFIDLCLLFYLTKTIYNSRVGLWVVSIFTFSFYSVLASTMVDVDGAVMPMFFLLMSIFYVKLKECKFKISNRNILWLFLLTISAIGSFFIKISGILPIFALFFDFLIENKIISNKKEIIKYISFGIIGVLVLVLLLIGSKVVFPFFNFHYSLVYWEHFAVFKNRGWMQTLIQFVKSLLYLSPFLVLPILFISREIYQKTRPFFLFIGIGLVFYLLVFDFSLGALDRYFQFLIIPLSIIMGVIVDHFIHDKPTIKFGWLLFGTLLIFAISLSQSLPHLVVPLYPKIEWISRIFSFHWEFLYPFFGGSGPLGFYISFLFIGLMWVFGFVLVCLYFYAKNYRSTIMLLFLILGLVYNGTFIREYLTGAQNGSAPKLVRDSVMYIQNHPSIQKVLVYNDNGGWDVRGIGVYERRMYATPEFEESYKNVLKSFSGHILYINIPKIMTHSVYSQYIDTCQEVYKREDKYIASIIYDCQKRIVR